MKAFISIFLSLLAFSFFVDDFSQAQTSLNDVSLLLPLPKNSSELSTNFLNASSALITGPLISSKNLRLFDWSDVDSTLDLTDRANINRLAVLAIRLDPCFRDHFTDPCRPQIRLVLQPILFSEAAPTTGDLGIHLFFDTTRENILSLIHFASNYRTQFLGVNSDKAPLQINPVIQQEGITGKFWQSFRPMIQNILNQSDASRFAVFTVHTSGRAWTFRSFDLNHGTSATPVTIPGLRGQSTERIDNQVQNSVIEFETSSGLLSASLPNSDQTFDYLMNSNQFRRVQQNQMTPLFITLNRIENPGTHLPGTIDCLSCHSTPAIRLNLKKNQVQSQQTIAEFISMKLPSSSLINLFEDHYESRDFRLFGYRNASPIVGQRVINESAAIVDSL